MRRVLSAGAGAIVLLVLLHARPAQAGGFDAIEEAHVRNMLNQTRAGEGLERLVSHPGMIEMARGQSVRMAEKGSIFHNENLGGEATSLLPGWLQIGENVGKGPDADLIQEALLESPGHYKNIVDPAFDSIGIGIVVAGDGTRFITQVFADLKDAPSAPTPPTPATPILRSTPAQEPPAPTLAPAKPAAPTVAAPPPVLRLRSDLNAVIGGLVLPAELSGALTES